MVLRWFRGKRDIPKLGRDHKISRATAYRYVDEVVDVLAAQAPDLHQVLERARRDGHAYVIMDGTLVSADRCAEQTISVKGEPIDAWYSGKAHEHAGNVQALSAPNGLPTLADSGYDGAGIGVLAPIKTPAGGQTLSTNNRTYNRLLRGLRALGERGFALLKGRWRILQHTTASPRKIGDITRAALILTHFEHGHPPEIQ
jgi:hypothetical protein